jgi:hypothetical protein
MTKTKHTPLPWDCIWDDPDGHSGTWRIVYGKDKDWTPYTIRSKVDMDFVIRAVNSHAELLEAAKLGAKMLLRNTLQDWEDTQAYRKLKSAIAKAEGVSK